MLDVLRCNPTIRGNNVFRSIIYKQFTERLQRKEQEAESSASEDSDEDAPPKKLSSEPRFSYKYNKSQKKLYPTAADINH